MKFLLGAVLVSAAYASTSVLEVAICDDSALDQKIVMRARQRATFIMQSASVGIYWRECAPDKEAVAPRVTVRLRKSPSDVQVAPALITSGRAFQTRFERSYAEVFVDAVAVFARRSGVDTGDILGASVAHEIGHLLLGGQHALAGVMTASMGAVEVAALRQNSLRFTSREREALVRELDRRARRETARQFARRYAERADPVVVER